MRPTRIPLSTGTQYTNGPTARPHRDQSIRTPRADTSGDISLRVPGSPTHHPLPGSSFPLPVGFPPSPSPSRADPTREALQIEAGEAALARIPPRAAMAEDADASPPPTGGDRKRRHASPVLPPPPPGPPPPGPHKRHRREEGGGGGFDRRRLGPVGGGGHEQDDRR